MDEYFTSDLRNFTSYIFKKLFLACAGFVTFALNHILGGIDAPVKFLATMFLLDIASSIATIGIKRKETAHNEDGYEFLGIRRMVVMIAMIGGCNIVDQMLGVEAGTMSFRNIIIYTQIAQEFSFVIRNAHILGLPVNDKILQIIDILKNTGNHKMVKREREDRESKDM